MSEQLTVENKPKRSVSWVWLVPIIALIMFGAVAWQSYEQQGPLVAIYFDDAAGVKAEKTVIRHRNVDVGMVEKVEFTNDMDGVVVHARMNKEFRPYLGETTKFWIVSAQVSGLRVTGLNTLLSGSYIEMDWDGKPTRRTDEFIGLKTMPITPPGTPGRRVRLTMKEGGTLNVGSSVFFKRIKVGVVETREMADNFSHVEFDAFIEAPYDKMITPATKFWNAAGLKVGLGDDGLDVQVESVEALLGGGVAFAPIGNSGGTPIAQDGHKYKVHTSRHEAEESLFDEDDSQTFRYIVEFDEGAKGLMSEAPIEYFGIQIGEVGEVAFEIGEPDDPNSGRIYAVLKLQPHRIGASQSTQAEFNQIMDLLVAGGMRAQLASSNFLTGSKYINFVEHPNADKATIDYNTAPYPKLPTVPTETEVLTTNVETFVENLSKAPIDELVLAATQLLRNTDKLVTGESTQKIPSEVVASLQSVQALTSNLDTAAADLPTLMASLNLVLENTDVMLSGISPESELHSNLTEAVRELKYAMRSVDALTQTLEQKPNALILGK